METWYPREPWRRRRRQWRGCQTGGWPERFHMQSPASSSCTHGRTVDTWWCCSWDHRSPCWGKQNKGSSLLTTNHWTRPDKCWNYSQFICCQSPHIHNKRIWTQKQIPGTSKLLAQRSQTLGRVELGWGELTSGCCHQLWHNHTGTQWLPRWTQGWASVCRPPTRQNTGQPSPQNISCVWDHQLFSGDDIHWQSQLDVCIVIMNTWYYGTNP